MTRGIRPETVSWIEAERALDPLALGPFVGALAVDLHVPFSVLAKMIDVHEQTVSRWVRSRGQVKASQMTKVVKVVALLCWMRDAKWRPLEGSMSQREQQLARALDQFLTATGASQKTTQEV